MRPLITERFEKQPHDLVAERIVKLDGFRARAYIRRNSYDFQCDVHGDVWTSVGWQRVVTVPITETKVAGYSYVTRDGEWKHAASADLDGILDTVATFLDGLDADVKIERIATTED